MNDYNLPQLVVPAGESTLGDERKIDLRETLATLYSQLPTIIAASLIILALAAAVIWRIQSSYTAVALLEVDPSEAQMVGVNQDNAVSGTTLTSLIETQVVILNSSRIALNVIKSLELWNDNEFGLEPEGSGLLSLFSFAQPPASSDAPVSYDTLTDRQRAELIGTLARKMNIERRGLTSVIGVGAKSTSPEKAARIANAYANAYIDVTIETRLQIAQRAAAFLQNQLDLLADNIKRDDEQVTRFILDNGEKFGTPETRSLLDTFKTKVSTLDAARSRLLGRINGVTLLTEGNDFSAAGKLELGEQFRTLSAKRQALASQLHSSNVSLKDQLAGVENQLRALAVKQLSEDAQQVKTYDAEIADARKSITETIATQNIPADLSVSLYRLQKESANNQRLYETYASRLSDVERIVGLPISSSRLIAEAIAPAKANAPSRTLLFLIAAVLAAGLGAAAGLVRHYYVGGFLSSAQLESLGGHQVIANVVETDGEPTLAIIANPDSGYGESIRRARVGLEGTSASGGAKAILVTSTDPGEGKTTIAISIARSFALSGRPTLLIDADLRRPRIAGLFGMTSHADLLGAISARQNPLDLSRFVWTEEASGLDILFAGDRGGIASDLILASSAFGKIIDDARQRYEYVVFDSPPVGHVVDALVLQRSADVVLYVVKSGSTNKMELRAAVGQMRRQQSAPPLYFILNRARNVLTGYGYAKQQYGYS